MMRAKNWSHADVMRVSGQSSSTVSQWMGKGSKVIHTIGKIEAAQRLEAESGFAALWLAKGEGPKMAPPSAKADPLHPIVAQILDWAKGMPPDQLLKLYAAAHNLVNSTAPVPRQPTQARTEHPA